MAEKGSSALLRPRVFFALLTGLVIAALLLTPSQEEGFIPTLTSRARGGFGARGFHDVAKALGWRPERRTTALRGGIDTTAVYAVLAPPVPLTASEVHALLEAVRGGAGLLLISQEGSPLDDSLGIRASGYSTPPLRRYRAGDSLGTLADLQAPYDSVMHQTLQAYAALRSDTVHFLTLLTRARLDTVTEQRRRTRRERRPMGPAPAILGIPFGRGRVVAIAEETPLQNMHFRRNGIAPLVMHALAWATPAPGARLVFSEYHFGPDAYPDPGGVVARALIGTPAGRVTVQLLVGGLLLLMAVAPRPVPPAVRTVIERRSPFEHVGALARAYEQIGATRTAVRNLLRGLRRRHPALARGVDEEETLDIVRARHPALDDATAIVSRTLRSPAGPRDLVEAGRALDEIERALKT